MHMTRDRLCFYLRKWHTLIEATVDAKTTDGYVMRLFCFAVTQRVQNQTKTTCYAQTAKIKKIRQMMRDIMREEVQTETLRSLVKKFIADSIGINVCKQCKHVFPLQFCHIKKVKILKKPKLDIARLMDMHAETADAGIEIDEYAEAQNALDAPVDSTWGAEVEEQV
eukprot:GHVO01049711.1.p2 GENE.GHVO01049711.1~~GHVO01049711.1.p2  ORF type:complete len:167 (+),score=34.74 GHVO01049711.1:200-700(+)